MPEMHDAAFFQLTVRYWDATHPGQPIWDLGLDLHVDACNEMLRCLPEQTSAELLGWLASLDTL